MDEIKDIIAETGEEAKMLAKFVKPVCVYVDIVYIYMYIHTYIQYIYI